MISVMRETITHFNLLLEALIANYFGNSRGILLFTDNANQPQVNSAKIPLVYWNVESDLGKKLKFRHFGCKDIIIQHGHPIEILRQFEDYLIETTERLNERKYIFLQGENSNRTMYFDIFKVAKEYYLYKVVAVLLDISGRFYDIFENSEQNLINRWFVENSSCLHGDNFQFSGNFLPNQNGREIQVGTFQYEPFAIIEGNGKYGGIEASLLSEFFTKYNFTPNITDVGEEQWGEIYDNGTGIGLMGTLANNKVYLGYGALYNWDRYYQYLDYTQPYVRTGVSCIVPAPNLLAGWLTPLLSFSHEMWLALAFVLLLNSCILGILLGTSQNNIFKALFMISRLHLLQSIRHLDQNKSKVSYFLGLNLIYVLLVSCVYSSGLSNVMTLPRYENPIRSVQDLALSGVKWAAKTEAWVIILQESDEPNFKILAKNFIARDADILHELAKTNKYAFSLERLPFGHAAIGPYIRKDVISGYILMQEDIYWGQCLIMLRKNSVLLPHLDILILRAFQSGLFAYWENMAVADYMDGDVQKAINYYSTHQHKAPERNLVKLRWTHVEGAFAILIFGYIISFIAFIAELFIKQRQHIAVSVEF